MELVNLYKENRPNGRIRLCAEVTYETAIDGRTQDIFYMEYPDIVANNITTSGSPWLVLLLPISAVLGEKLIIHRPVDPVLLEGCLEVLDIWKCWMPHLFSVEIEAKIQLPVARESTGKTGSYFSGGIDSMHTLLRHEDHSAGQRSENIDTLITILGIFGQEKDHVERCGADSMRHHIDAIARRYQKEVIEVHVNVYSTRFALTNSLHHSHSCLLAAVALGMGEYLARVLIPSSVTYKDIAPGGSHPLTDRLFSTSKTKFIPDANHVTRFQKMDYFVEKKHDLHSLQVCSRDPELKNCSQCYKCLRNMLMLETVDKLKECELFREPALDYKKVTRLYCSDNRLLHDLNQVITRGKATGRHDLVDCAETIIQQSSWICATRMLIRKLRYQRPLEAQDMQTLEEILGKRDTALPNTAVLQGLNRFIGRHPSVSMYLKNLLDKGYQKVFELKVAPDRSLFLQMEHALLSNMICESVLHFQLKDPQSELRQPELIFINGIPIFNKSASPVEF